MSSAENPQPARIRCAIVPERGAQCLVLRHRDAAAGGRIAFATAEVLPGDTLVDAAERAARDGLGARAEPTALVGIAHVGGSLSQEALFVFRAAFYGPCADASRPAADVACEWVSAEELGRLAERPELSGRRFASPSAAWAARRVARGDRYTLDLLRSFAPWQPRSPGIAS